MNLRQINVSNQQKIDAESRRKWENLHFLASDNGDSSQNYHLCSQVMSPVPGFYVGSLILKVKTGGFALPGLIRGDYI